MSNLQSRHIDNVIAVGMGGGAPVSGPEGLFHKSWARCLKQHGLDPTRPTPARILPSMEVREHQQRMDGFLRVARAGMEELYRRVADLGYMTLLTDADGITVEYIGNPATEQQLKAAGLYLGADWNESHAGTCGVGTCLIEQATITCHQAEHFDATHISLTCTSSPLFAPDGQLLGVLDVSALHSPEARESQHLALHLTSMYAQMIEDANFLRSFGSHWILRLGKSCGLVEVAGDVMLAFDEDGVILGANTGARRRFGGVNGARSTNSQLVGQTLMEVLDITMDAVWSVARGGSGMDAQGFWSYRHEHYYPSIVPPRARLGGVSPARASLPLVVEHAAAEPVDGRNPARSLDRLVGGDGVMQRLISQSKRLVDRKVNLLIHGETGSGKEVLAKALHEYSGRARKPFVAVNCASIPETLIESELFGYTPGSFTGGKSKGMKGLIAQSDGGTLFLDEIGDMPLHLQTRFLRVLSESEVLPLGAEQPIAVNLNVIAATHRDLRERVEQGSFREDLYYRLCGATLFLPPLRDRDDRQYLIETLAREEAQRLGFEPQLSAPALQLLLDYAWPGNIRELRNALRFALALSGDEAVMPADLPAEISTPRGVPAHASPRPASAIDSVVPLAVEPPTDSEAAHLLQALKKNKWSITSAAQELGVCRATIYRQMKRYAITPPHLA